jgi:cation diffusion facilitator family transporter
VTGTQKETARQRDRSIRRVLVVVLVLNATVALAKLVVGWLSSSISMVADGFHSLTDGASNVVGLIGMSIAGRPPDEDHPYGHRKFETVAAIIIGALLALTAWEVFKSLLERLQEGGQPQATNLTFAVMIVTIAINIGVTTWEHRAARKYKSDILHADAAHTLSDVFASLAVIVSLIAARLGFPQLDLVAALVITVMIGRAAFQILRDNGLLLTDTAILPAAEIEAVALEVPGVVSVHKIRSRRGPRGGHADLHVQIAGELPLEEAHRIGHQVADRLREELELPDVLVHVEPPEAHRTV